MAKTTTGSTFGLNIPQTQACRLMAEGHDVPEIILMTRGVTKKDNRKMYDRYRKELVKWMQLDGWAECYKAIVRERAMPAYGKAFTTISKQLDDPNGWLANKAANDVLTRFGPAIMGEEDKQIVVQVQGMPEMGEPGADDNE